MVVKRICLFLIALFMMTPASWATAPPHLWSKSFGDSLDQQGVAISDNAGNIIATGYQEGTVNYGGGPLTSSGKWDIFLAKFNAAGTHLWSYVFGDTGTQYSSIPAVGSSGNIVLAANFDGTVDFGGGNLTSAGSNDIALAKFDTDGTHLWSQKFGDANEQHVGWIAVDGSENIVMTGSFNGTVDFGGGGLTSSGGQDMYLIKLDASGTHLWSKRFGNMNFLLAATGVNMDTVGNVTMTGIFSDSVDFGGGILATTSPWDIDIFLMKFDASGSHLWSRRFGDSNPQQVMSMAVDESGNMLITGLFSGSVDFGGEALTTTGVSDYDIFLAKFNANGNHLWSKRFGDSSNMQVGTSVAVDNSGNVLLCANLMGSVDFGGGTLTSAGANDITLAMFDASGTYLWSERFGDAGEQSYAMADIDESENVILSGSFNDTHDFGGELLTSAGMSDIYMVKLGSIGNAPIVVNAIPDTMVVKDSPPVDNYRDLNNVFSDVEDGTVLGFTIQSHSNPELVNVVVDADSAVDLSFAPGEVGSATIVIRATDSQAAFVEDTMTVIVAAALPNPHIYAVRDVPGDEGGFVNVAWDASNVDTPEEHLVTKYTVWRAIVPELVAQMVIDGAVLVKDGSEALRKQHEILIREEHLASTTYYWNLVKSVDAYYLEGYSEPVPTLFDSTAVCTEYHYFQIIAHTSDPYTFWTSPPDSGYSVDNLTPAVPCEFTGQYDYAPLRLSLWWHPNTEHDLAGYRVYMGAGADFIPSESNLVVTTLDTIVTGLNIFPAHPTHFKLSAVDVHGNESGHAILPPTEIPISTLVTNYQSIWKDNAIEVTWELGEVESNMEYRVARKVGSSSVYHEFNCSIKRTGTKYSFRDASVKPGESYAYIVTIIKNREEMGTFETTMIVPVMTLELKQNYPNPFNQSTMIAFILPEKMYVDLSVYSVDGELVRTLKNELMDWGNKEYQWDGSDDRGSIVSSGLYLYRLKAGRRVLTKKMMYLK